MNRQRYLTVFVAIACILGLGISATAIETSLSTHPDDVLDFDYSYLPFSEEVVQTFKSESWRNAGRKTSPAQNEGTSRNANTTPFSTPSITPTSTPTATHTPTSTPTTTPTPTSTPSTTPTPTPTPTFTLTPPRGPTSTPSTTSTPTGDGDGGGDGSDGGSSNNTNGSGGNGTATGSPAVIPNPSQSTCTGGVLLTLLADLLPIQVNPCGSLLPFLLPVLLVLVAVGVGYRYRERVPGAVHRVNPSHGRDLDRTPADEGFTPWPTEPPSNEIHEAWLKMVKRANPDRPWTRTPAECASAAVEAGMDSEAVRTITTLFEDVRYADEPATEERSRQAREQLRRLDESGGS